jgi:hypothetical protein
VDKHGYGFSDQKLNGSARLIRNGDARPVPPLPAGSRRGAPDEASRCVTSVCITNKDDLPVLDRSRYAGVAVAVAVAVAEHRGAAAVVPLAMSRHRRET